MKKIIFFLFLLAYGFGASAQNETTSVCRFGFTFEISSQQSWGLGKPVVLSVAPNTSADASGLRVNDVIDEINGQSTENQTAETIITWLQYAEKEIYLKVSNFHEKDKQLSLLKYCNLNNTLNEKDLAGVYDFYSLEDMQTYAFDCPFSTKSAQGVNLKRYKTFGFSNINSEYKELEEIINSAIRKELEEKGLVYSVKNPDLIVQTFYSYNINPNYRKSSNVDKFPVASRYNKDTRNMEQLPLYYNLLISSDQAAFFLKFGIRFVTKVNGQLAEVWECEANEMIQSEEYTLKEYVALHIPLMFMQFPYIKSREAAHFYFNRSSYNFTGIRYNMNNLREITEIESMSPAEKAGLQPGDKIEKINGIKFESNPKTADNMYKQFILRTMPLRDAKTQYTNAKGFTKCMLWDKFKYAQVYDAMINPNNGTAFSYLFYFKPYINLSGSNIVTFSIERGKRKIEIKVKPVIVKEEVFENR
jgi:hypothetical protein